MSASEYALPIGGGFFSSSFDSVLMLIAQLPELLPDPLDSLPDSPALLSESLC